MKRVLIEVRGGLVEDVWCDDDVDVLIINHDVDDVVDEEELESYAELCKEAITFKEGLSSIYGTPEKIFKPGDRVIMMKAFTPGDVPWIGKKLTIQKFVGGNAWAVEQTTRLFGWYQLERVISEDK